MKARRITGDVVIYVILTVMAVIWLLPILWLVLQSFSTEGGSLSQSRFIPKSFGFENYIAIFTNQRWSTGGWASNYMNHVIFFDVERDGTIVIGSFFNTLIVAFGTMIFATLLTLMTSYALSRLRFRGRTIIMKICLVMGMFPGFLSLIIMYWLFRLIETDLGIPMGLWTLIFLYSAGAGAGYYISKGFFDTISKQIDEAAMIDGASRFQIFYKITLPLSKPIIVYTALTAFMGPWGEYITSSFIIRNDSSMMTVAVELYKMAIGTDGTSEATDYWGSFCAAAVFIAIPVSILFVFMQKYYVSGVTGGAVKG